MHCISRLTFGVGLAYFWCCAWAFAQNTPGGTPTPCAQLESELRQILYNLKGMKGKLQLVDLLAKIEAAKEDAAAAEATMNEAKTRHDISIAARSRIGQEDFRASELTWRKTKCEHEAKVQAIQLAIIDKDLAEIKLRLHEVRPMSHLSAEEKKLDRLLRETEEKRRVARIEAAKADAAVAKATMDEAKVRIDLCKVLFTKGAINEEEFRVSMLTWEKTRYEHESKVLRVQLAIIDKDLADLEALRQEMRKLKKSESIPPPSPVAPGPRGGPPPQGQDNLETVLRGWEKAMTDLQSFAVEINRSSLEKQLNTKDDFDGWAVFSKGTDKRPSRAHLDLKKVNNPAVFEKYICDGSTLYEYAPALKKVRMHQMLKNKMGSQQESFLSFLFGVSSQQAVSRYGMEYKGSDKYYHYLRILPKMDHDKNDFSEARLSLLRSNNLPAQIWCHQPNGYEVSWTFSKMQVNVPIPDSYFDPVMPKDWTKERVKRTDSRNP